MGSGGKDKNERGEAHVAEGKGDEGKEGDADEAGERDREVSDALFQVMREEVVEVATTLPLGEDMEVGDAHVVACICNYSIYFR